MVQVFLSKFTQKQVVLVFPKVDFKDEVVLIPKATAILGADSCQYHLEGQAFKTSAPFQWLLHKQQALKSAV